MNTLENIKSREPYPAIMSYKKYLEYEETFTNYRYSFNECKKIFASVDEDFTEEECSLLVKATENFPNIDFSKINITIRPYITAFSPKESAIWLQRKTHWDAVGKQSCVFYFVICHEMRHVDQYQSGILRNFDDGHNPYMIWDGNTKVYFKDVHETMNPFYRDIRDYHSWPWEADANAFALECVRKNNMEFLNNNYNAKAVLETAKLAY